MTFDRLDICEAWYLYLSAYHDGMGSVRYQRLSRLLEHFTPAAWLQNDWCSTSSKKLELSANGREIYEQLVTGGES